jgi:ELWxxDGT repeat protein
VRTRPSTACFEPCEPRRLLSVELVRDVNTTTAGAVIEQVVEVGGTIYLDLLEPTAGRQLWKVTGGGTGLALVKQINRPASNPDHLTDVNGTLFFSPLGAGSGHELWKSDGTDAGTVQVKEIAPGNSQAYPGGLTTMGGVLYFHALSPSLGRELWRSDGTADGTYLVKDIAPGAAHALEYPESVADTDPTVPMAVVGSTLYFTANDGVNGIELWKSDGTADGTVMVANLAAGSASSTPTYLTPVGDLLYFFANDQTHGMELWKTDGTRDGTVLVKDLRPGVSGSAQAPYREPSALWWTMVSSGAVNADGLLYFTATSSEGRRLWRSDGTEAGTVPIAPAVYPELALANGSVYFTAGTSADAELWRARIGEGGVVERVKDIKPGGSSSPRHFHVFGGELYFSAADGATTARTLWRSDGTEAGTRRVSELPLAMSSHNGNTPCVAMSGGVLYFAATDPRYGTELFRSDGTPEGTALVVDANKRTNPSSATPRVALPDGSVLFTATDALTGIELWRTDDTAAGAHLVSDLMPGSLGSEPTQFLRFGDRVYFQRRTHVSGAAYEVWRTDGTAAGTTKVVGVGRVSGVTLSGAGDAIYYVDYVAAELALWRIEAATGVVSKVRAFNRVGAYHSGSEQGAYFEGRYYFGAAVTAEEPLALWQTDGTPEGTRPFDVAIADPRTYQVVGDMLYVSVPYNGSNTALLRTDGTAEGTGYVLYPSGERAASGKVVGIGGAAFLASAGAILRIDPATGRTAAAGVNVNSPAALTPFGGYVYFVQSDEAHGRELWRTDGAAAGTTLVKDIRPGAYGGFSEIDGISPTTYLVVVGDMLYFAATDGRTGIELWRSDGTERGTRRVTDLSPGSSSAAPNLPLVVGGDLYFSATTLAFNRELWRLPADAVAPAVVDAAFDAGRRAIVVRFGEDVEGSLDAAAVGVTGPGGAAVAGAVTSFAWDAATLTATFHLRRDLPDGDYRATLAAAAATDQNGNALAAGSSVDFFVLAGDANHDRRVDFADLVALAQNYDRPTGKTWADGDFTGDGAVDFNDLVVLAQRYDTALRAPAAAAALPAAPVANGKTKTANATAAVTAPLGAQPALTKAAPVRPLAPAAPKKLSKPPFAHRRIR